MFVIRKVGSTGSSYHKNPYYNLNICKNLSSIRNEKPEILQKREKRKQRERLELLEHATKNAPSFQQTLESHSKWPLQRDTNVTTLQVNIGKRCNLTCHHCHVESGPTRTENMDQATMTQLVKIMKNTPTLHTVDITGGAPELNPHFKFLVEEARSINKTVIDRCNLTVFYEKGMEDLPEFLAKNKVQVVASLPCYTPQNVEKQRGKGVFDQSIEALKRLNDLGYGKEGTGLELHLVYNPVGPSLPGAQQKLEADYKRELLKHCNIVFNHLITITNMPIKRFADDLLRLGEYQKYMDLLISSFNPQTVEGLMCKNLVSVSWDGKLYDCDFNQALEMAIKSEKQEQTIWTVSNLNVLSKGHITTGYHCYGCTAGSGSSCSGAISS